MFALQEMRREQAAFLSSSEAFDGRTEYVFEDRGDSCEMKSARLGICSDINRGLLQAPLWNDEVQQLLQYSGPSTLLTCWAIPKRIWRKVTGVEMHWNFGKSSSQALQRENLVVNESRI